MLAFEGKIVSDHGDKFAVGGFSLDAAHSVAEEALERLHVAAVPRDLDGMKGLRPSGERLAWLFCGLLYWFIHRLDAYLFIGMALCYHKRAVLSNF